jgi:Raf kinase inhibitor-like YbhB/YbcL family protein
MIAAFALSVALAGMTLQSADFRAGGSIAQTAMSAGCGGKNRSPELHWSGVPRAAKSFALIEHDPDAPMAGGFYHWVVYNIPGNVRRLPAGTALAPDQLGAASTGRAAYHGPCPPPGPAHRYVFTLYALDVARLPAGSPLTATELLAAVDSHVVARATLVGMAARP